jgi:hypothetical protein
VPCTPLDVCEAPAALRLAAFAAACSTTEPSSPETWSSSKPHQITVDPASAMRQVVLAPVELSSDRRRD